MVGISRVETSRGVFVSRFLRRSWRQRCVRDTVTRGYGERIASCSCSTNQCLRGCWVQRSEKRTFILANSENVNREGSTPRLLDIECWIACFGTRFAIASDFREENFQWERSVVTSATHANGILPRVEARKFWHRVARSIPSLLIDRGSVQSSIFPTRFSLRVIFKL